MSIPSVPQPSLDHSQPIGAAAATAVKQSLKKEDDTKRDSDQKVSGKFQEKAKDFATQSVTSGANANPLLNNPLTYAEASKTLVCRALFLDRPEAASCDQTLKAFSKPEQVLHLTIDQTSAKDLSFLSLFPLLQSLTIVGSYGFKNLEALKNCKKLEKIIVKECGLESLKGIQGLPLLTDVTVNKCPKLDDIDDIPPGLIKLDLAGCSGIVTLLPVTNLVGLEEFNGRGLVKKQTLGCTLPMHLPCLKKLTLTKSLFNASEDLKPEHFVSAVPNLQVILQ